MTGPPPKKMQFHLSTAFMALVVSGGLMWIDGLVAHESAVRLAILIVLNVVIVLSLALLMEFTIRREDERKR